MAGVLAAQTAPSQPDPATMIQMRVAMLASLLNLTDAQKTEATTIFTNAQSASQTVRDSLQTQRQSLAAAVKANNTATIDSLSQTIGSLEGQLVAINSKAEAAFYAILTADQQAKYDSTSHGLRNRGPGGFGHPGFAGPGR